MTDSISRTDEFIASLGVEAYRVGGSVRDEILERRPKDADYMVRGVTLERLGGILRTAAKGRVVKALKLRDGRQAGWRVLDVEIVLPRTETSTGPGHRDFAITIDPSITLDEDAKRRDFTFNALYKLVGTDWPPHDALIGEVYDPLGTGIHDLKHKLVRVTHADSFRDDPLRILRALRFVSVLGYDLDPETLALMHVHADAVDGLSASGHVSGTVYEEMSKLLMGRDVAKSLRIARDTGVLGKLLPELEPMIGFDQESKYHDMTVDEHVFRALDVAAQTDAPLEVRWSLLFHDSGKPKSAWRGKDGRLHYYSKRVKVSQLAHTYSTDDDPDMDVVTQSHEDVGEVIWRTAADRINVPSKTRERVATLIRHHMLDLNPPKTNKVRKWRVKHGDDVLSQLILHRACDCSGKDSRGADWAKQMATLSEIRTLQQQAIDNKIPSKATDLAINGHDLIKLGYEGGMIGNAQKKLLHEVITGQVENDRDALIARVERW